MNDHASRRRSRSALSRRRFLNQAAGGALGMATGIGLAAAARPARAATSAAPRSRAAAASEKVVLAFMGVRGRGNQLVQSFAGRSDVAVAYVCDVDSSLLPSRAATVESAQGKTPKTVSDFRRILEDKAVDALVIATPDHWHALATVLACQAGKDVYVEKPASQSIWEGRKMVEAARRYQRVVQLGTQTRSAAYASQAVDYIRGGKLGSIHLVRVFNMKYRDPLPARPDGTPPAGVDYDMWLGPAPKRPFNENHFHYAWHWFWNYAGGDITNDGVHQLDLARWAVGKDYPKAVYCTGGKLAYDDPQETPDTQIVTYDYDDLIMTFEQTLYTPYMLKTNLAFRNTDQFPYWPQDATRIELYGSKAMMILARHGDGWQVFGSGGKVLDEGNGPEPTPAHIDNFLQCVRDRGRPNADIEEGHRSTILCHLANISYRVGKRRLIFDGQTETIVGDEEANQLLRRQYRSPWTVPEVV